MNTPKVKDADPIQNPEVTAALAESIRYTATTYRIGVVVGLAFGGIVCAGGLVLVLLGFSGSIEWVVQAAGLNSKLANASPGAFFALVGFLILWRFKPKIEDDLSIRPGARSSSLRQSFEEAKSLAALETSWRHKGDDIHYRGSK